MPFVPWKKRKSENTLRSFHEAEEAEQMAKLLYTLLFGFFAGILGMVMKKESLLYDTGFLDSYTLSPVKFLEPDAGELLQGILLKRIGAAVLLMILSTTYLGCAAAYFYQVWSGLAIGVFAAGSMIRYGGKGILLVLGSLLPQQIVFLPAYLLLSAKCCELCRIMYFRGLSAGFSGKDRNRLLANKIFRMCLVILIIMLGCLAEAYSNPPILRFVLKSF